MGWRVNAYRLCGIQKGKLMGQEFNSGAFKGPRPLTVTELRNHLQQLELRGHGGALVYHGGDGQSPCLIVAGGAVGQIEDMQGLILAPVPLNLNGGF
jgi:hypothetical protein